VLDSDERDRIRKQYETEPGKGHLAEQAMTERANALVYRDDATVLRTEADLARLGYQTPEARRDAAAARREDAQRRAREEQRIRENRGEAAARDDGGGGPEAQKAGVTDAGGNPAGQDEAKDEGKAARRQPPAGRRGPARDKT
jgi:hypothetical protein